MLIVDREADGGRLKGNPHQQSGQRTGKLDCLDKIQMVTLTSAQPYTKKCERL